MMDKILDPRLQHGLGDHRLSRLGWSPNGEDLRLTFQKPGGGQVIVTASWATEIRIDIDFGEYSGMPLVFESHVDHTERRGLHFRVEFGAAPEGYISCRCTSLVIE